MEFAESLYKLRQNANMTQRQLADILGVSDTNIQNWENSRSETSFEMLIKIADVFDVSVDDVLGRVWQK